MVTPSNAETTFFHRHEFLIRRIHSLLGLIPVGLYMVIHLIANASILNGVEAFQNIVYQIHSLGNALVVVEWVFIFIPILIHALFGFVFIYYAKGNVAQYPYRANYRYVLQRITGILAFIFIAAHVMHLNGLIHAEWFRETVADAIGIAQFRPYNAASTAGQALQNPLVVLFYLVGLLACVYHFANGIWTMGITWGVWVTPKAQELATRVCLGIGVVVALIGVSALFGFWQVDVESARERELQMYKERAADGSILPDEHKLYSAPMQGFNKD